MTETEKLKLNEKLARLERQRDNAFKLPIDSLPRFYLNDIEFKIYKLRELIDSESKGGKK